MPGRRVGSSSSGTLCVRSQSVAGKTTLVLRRASEVAVCRSATSVERPLTRNIASGVERRLDYDQAAQDHLRLWQSQSGVLLTFDATVDPAIGASGHAERRNARLQRDSQQCLLQAFNLRVQSRLSHLRPSQPRLLFVRYPDYESHARLESAPPEASAFRTYPSISACRTA